MRQLYFAVRTHKQLDPQLFFQLIDTVAHRAGRQRQLLRRQRKRLMPGGDFKGIQLR